ncbi:MAG: tetratricopeptide repeat protein [Chitinophagales bacterium]
MIILKSRFFKYLNLFFLLLFPFYIVLSHGIAEEQIADLTYHIEHFYEETEAEEELSIKRQKDTEQINRNLAMLYFERGQLYQERGIFQNAFNDYIFLLDKQSSLEIVNLTLAELFFEHDFFYLSLLYVNKFLEIHENHIKALECKAKTLENLGFYDEAIGIYQNVISLALEDRIVSIDYLEPSHFIQLAEVLEKRKFFLDKTFALKYLQLGIDMLGKLPSLQNAYIEFAISNKMYNEALVKIDEVLDESREVTKIKYLLKKAEINVLFNCYEDASFYYQNAKINNAQLSQRHILMNRDYFLEFHLLCNTNNFEITI